MSTRVPDDRALRTPLRHGGYAPIADYAVIGNKRTAALIALDGSIDWLCLPGFDGPSAFGALLDPARGGRFTLRPAGEFAAARRYRGETNVLETTFETAGGSARVTDFMSVGEARPVAGNEIVRRIDGLSGSVALEWHVQPRFEFGAAPPGLRRAGAAVLMSHGTDVLALQSLDAGEPAVTGDGASGSVTLREGDQALLVLSAFDDCPILLPERDELERRFEVCCDYWQRWSGGARYDGEWRDAVLRSLLALDLMVSEPDGSMIAAVTSSLPERIGGDRNYDYRYAWVRDTTFAMDALLRMGYPDAFHAMLVWLLHTARRTHPRVHTFYGIDGRVHDSSTELGLAGYRGSKPVRAGNDAGSQLQLGNFGDLMHTTWLFVRDGNALDPQTGRQLAETADLLCDLWRNADSSIWEFEREGQYTQSKMSSWLAFERAIDLAERGELPAGNVERWRRERAALREFIETDCYDALGNTWVAEAGDDALDASVLLIAGMGFAESGDERLHGTIDTIRAELSRGPLLFRRTGMEEVEGCFLACSFWLVEALARANRLEEAHALMEELVPLSNDVGLFSEEIDPQSGEMLGNFPQALTHLSLVNAAFAFEEMRVRASHGDS
jgi:GH15 family glucan-1,4-alpha-glucosidase